MPELIFSLGELAASLSQNVELPAYIRSIEADGDALVVHAATGPFRTKSRISMKDYSEGLLTMHVEMNSVLEKVLSLASFLAYDGVQIDLPHVHISVNDMLAGYVSGMEVTDVTFRSGTFTVIAAVQEA